MKNRLLKFMVVLMLVGVLALMPGMSATAAGNNNGAPITAGLFNSLAIKSGGSLWGWGGNGHGQLGIEPYTATKIHMPIKIMDNVVSVATGWLHILAIKNDGSLWALGGNENGQLGDGTATNSFTPVKVMDNVVSVAAGSLHSLAIKNDGSLWTWGYNFSGSLGDGTTTDSYTPVKIMDNVVSVAAGSNHSLAIKKDGSLWAWGSNEAGQLGIEDSTAINIYVPVKVMDNVVSVAAGKGYTLAIKADGSLWAWGYNENGQLGNGTTRDSFTPVKVMDNAASVTAGERHSLAIKKDGSLWAWGCNESGQLGIKDSTAISIYVPVQVMDNAISVAAGGAHTLAIKADGSLWAWGSNEVGQFGNGTNIGSNIPTKVRGGVMLPNGASVTPATQTAKPTSSSVLIDGKQVSFDAYNIEGNNYFKLRDMAMALNGSAKQFEVEWHNTANTITLTSASWYSPVGGELTKGSTGNKQAILATSKVYLDGEELWPTAYNIGGNNYFKLRDLGAELDFSVVWNGTSNTITIDTSIGYTE
jgi:alpha-tubulin suppressor-like RCC1 family protein